MNNLIVYPYEALFDILTEYLYDNYNSCFTNFSYRNECFHKTYEYRLRKHTNKKLIKSLEPYDCNFTFKHIIDNNDIEFKCKLIIITKDNIPEKYYHLLGHEGGEDRIQKTLTISSIEKDNIIKFVDIAKENIKKKHEENKKSSNETIRIYYYARDYWTMLSKTPKRNIDTLYLKEGQKESIIEIIDTFFKEETRNIYLSYGMPYKHVVMLYGIPGTGKTTTITVLASHFDCDIYTIPITKELTDYGLIESFTNINDKEDRKKIIVLEDIDCIFDKERKEGDDNNMLTLQTLLNCLDGHTCAEGTLLFMTANNPDKMDYAMVDLVE